MTNVKHPVAVLESMRPAAPVDADALERARARVMAQTLESSATPGVRRPVRRRRALIAAASVAAAAVAGVAALTLGQAVSAPPAAATPPMLSYATDVLAVAEGTAESGSAVAAALAAATAGQQPAAQTSEVSLVESAYWNLDAVREAEGSEDYRLVVVPTERLVWASAVDGSMRFREVVGVPMDQDGTVELPGVSVSGPAVIDYTLPADHDRGAITPALLPTDPVALLDAVSESRPRHGCDLTVNAGAADCLADALGSLTQICPVPTALQSAFWEAIGDQEGVYTLGTTTDRLGRDGVTLAYLAPEGTVDVLIADPDTGALLGTESVDITGDITDSDEPAVWWMEVFQPARWVADLETS